MSFSSLHIFSLFLLLASLLALPHRTLAHGYIASVSIDGKSYKGNLPAESNTRHPSVVRQIRNTQPVKGVGNKDLACGSGATPASLIADAMPGNQVRFDWKGAGSTSWPHNAGPILTYMASCGSVSCDKFDASTARWFKIAELGKKPNGQWHMADVQAGQPVTVTIPSTLAPGNYLIRQELIALHIAMTLGGVEFYASCTQLRVGGSQTGRPAENDLVSFPGAYGERDPGLYVPGIYEPGFQYVIPGPRVARIANGGSGGGAPPAPTSAKASSTTVGAPSPTKAAPPADDEKPTKAPASSPLPSPAVKPSAPASPPAAVPTTAAASVPESRLTAPVKVCQKGRRLRAKTWASRTVKPVTTFSISLGGVATPTAAIVKRSRHHARHFVRSGLRGSH
ncbi:hypothetical protein H1R20_g4889, partial [Candolleomyces eurysporus]